MPFFHTTVVFAMTRTSGHSSYNNNNNNNHNYNKSNTVNNNMLCSNKFDMFSRQLNLFLVVLGRPLSVKLFG